MVNKKMLWVIMLLATALLFIGTAAASPGDNVIEINQDNYLEVLQNIGTTGYPLTGDYALTENIVITETEWVPIGTYLNPFKGTLDGQGYTITFENEVTFIREGEIHKRDGYGLFGNTKSAAIKDLNLAVNNMTAQYLTTDGNVDENLYAGTAAFQPAVGPLAGWVQGAASGRDQIINCTVSGVNDDVAVSGYSHIGGMVGLSVQLDITNSSSTVNVDSGNIAGGLISYSDWTNYTDCYATGDIKTEGSTAGGLVGFLYVGNIDNSYAAGNISGKSSIGGLVGTAGVNHSVTPAQPTPQITNSYATGDATASAKSSGGLIGTVSCADVSGCYATGNAVSKDAAGGLIGTMQNGTVNECFSVGDVEVTNATAGGLIGTIGISAPPELNPNLVHTVTVENSYTTSNVTASDNAGGLIGTVTVNKNSEDATVDIAFNYAAGTVNSGGSKIGGLIGNAKTNVEVNVDESNLYDINKNNGYGIYKQTDDMYQAETFKDMGWELSEDVWFVNEGYDYPRFAWQIFVTYSDGRAVGDATNMPAPLIVATNGTGSVFSINNNEPVWGDEEFLGWLNCEDDLTYDGNEKIVIGKQNITLLAQWEFIEYEKPSGVIEKGNQTPGSSGTGSATIVEATPEAAVIPGTSINEGSGVIESFTDELAEQTGNAVKRMMPLGIFIALVLFIFVVYYGYRQTKKEE